MLVIFKVVSIFSVVSATYIRSTWSYFVLLCFLMHNMMMQSTTGKNQCSPDCVLVLASDI